MPRNVPEGPEGRRTTGGVIALIIEFVLIAFGRNRAQSLSPPPLPSIHAHVVLFSLYIRSRLTIVSPKLLRKRLIVRILVVKEVRLHSRRRFSLPQPARARTESSTDLTGDLGGTFLFFFSLLFLDVKLALNGNIAQSFLALLESRQDALFECSSQEDFGLVIFRECFEGQLLLLGWARRSGRFGTFGPVCRQGRNRHLFRVRMESSERALDLVFGVCHPLPRATLLVAIAFFVQPRRVCGRSVVSRDLSPTQR